MSNEELFAFIGAWAKANHFEKYEATLKVAKIPATFRRYLVRLVEIRVEEDRTFLREVPLSVLDDSKLRVKMRHRPTGAVVECAGRLAEGERVWSFAELAATPEDFALLMAAREHLDMVVYNGT